MRFTDFLAMRRCPRRRQKPLDVLGGLRSLLGGHVLFRFLQLLAEQETVSINAKLSYR